MTEPTTDETPAADPPPAPDPPRAQRETQLSISPWLLVAVLVIGGLVVTNFLLLNRVSDLEQRIDSAFESLGTDVAAISGSVDDVTAMVDEVEGRLDDINALALASGAGSSSVAPEGVAPTGADAGLPLYDETQPDSAVGLQIAGLEGPEYYSGETLLVNAADGKARAWLVWAHWCPFCQEEMPDLKTWVEQNAADFPDFELVSVTTAMDDERGNPLVPYLDELELPFPVIVDSDGSLAAQLGLNAFPFWVFTGPDGTVLGRSAGLLGQDQFVSIFQQLQDIASA